MSTAVDGTQQPAVSPGDEQAAVALLRLSALIARLFTPGDGDCWSLERTVADFGQYLAEEAGELLAVLAALGNVPVPLRIQPGTVSPALIANVQEELGDVLWNVLVLAHLAEQAGWCTWRDVLEGVEAKMRARNAPFLSGGKRPSVAQVNQHWAAQKAIERKKTHAETV